MDRRSLLLAAAALAACAAPDDPPTAPGENRLLTRWRVVGGGFLTPTLAAPPGTPPRAGGMYVKFVAPAAIALRGPDLLRVKGFLDVEGCQGPVVVQFVQHLAHPPVELERWPDGKRFSRVVFITRNISEAQVRGLIEAVRSVVPAQTGTQ